MSISLLEGWMAISCFGTMSCFFGSKILFFSIISDILVHHHCSVSSLAWFMSNQETSFVTIGQRVLARPLKYVFLLYLPSHVIQLVIISRKLCDGSIDVTHKK